MQPLWCLPLLSLTLGASFLCACWVFTLSTSPTTVLESNGVSASPNKWLVVDSAHTATEEMERNLAQGTCLALTFVSVFRCLSCGWLLCIIYVETDCASVIVFKPLCVGALFPVQHVGHAFLFINMYFTVRTDVLYIYWNPSLYCHDASHESERVYQNDSENKNWTYGLFLKTKYNGHS